MFAYGFTELKFEENTAANAFEMVNSLLFENQGRDAYDEWARSAFGPLIEAAYEAYCTRKYVCIHSTSLDKHVDLTVENELGRKPSGRGSQ